MAQTVEKTMLIEAGLSRKEADTYLALLQCDDLAMASTLAKRLSTSRSHIYDTLQLLIEKGLVSHVIKNNRKHFRAAPPDKILDYLQERKEMLKKSEEKIRELLPNLQKIQKLSENKYSAEIYEGPEGLKTILNDILRSRPKEWLDFSSAKSKEVLPFFINNWQKRRSRIGINAKMLIDDTKEGRMRGLELSELKNTEVRYMPSGVLSPAHIYIYGHKVAIMLWSEETTFAVLLKNKEIADRFTYFFDWFWKIAYAPKMLMESRHKVNFYEFMEQANRSIDIIMLNALEPLHEGRNKIVEILKRGGRVRVLVMDPRGAAFRDRVLLEERHITDVKESRIWFELKSVMANIRDIESRTKRKVDVRFYSSKPQYMMIILDSMKMLFSKYVEKPGEYGSVQPVVMLDKTDSSEAKEMKEKYEEIWKKGKEVDCEDVVKERM